MSVTHLVLVRHGHTADNGGSADPLMSGWTDVPLSELGQRQAVALEHRVRADVVYTSPLARAFETARHCADGHDVVCDPALREIGCGEADGVRVSIVRARFPEAWAANEAQRDDGFRWPGGESYAELRQRAVSAVCAIAARHGGARVAIVTHTGVITQVLGHLAGTPAARWSAFRVGNASLTEIDWEGARGTVRALDVRDHLPASLRT